MYSFFNAKKTSSTYSAIFRTAVPAVIGTLIKFSETEVSDIFTYKNKEKCQTDYILEPFRSINKVQNNIIRKAGLYEPETATFFIGAIIAGLLVESQGGNTLSYLSRATKKMLEKLKGFVTTITKEELTYAVTLIAGVLATELSDHQIKKTYGFDSSGHFKTAITYELLNCLTLRVIQRLEQRAKEEEPVARHNYNNTANVIVWLNSLLCGITLSFTSRECHTLEEVVSGIGLGLLVHTASCLLSQALNKLTERCFLSSVDESEETDKSHISLITIS